MKSHRTSDALGRTLASLAAFGRKPLVPARATDLAVLEKLVGPLPGDLRALYGVGANFDTLPETDGGSLLSLGTAIASVGDLRKHGLPDTVVPIATDGAGNFLGMDVRTSKLVDWDHETRRLTKVARTLAAQLDRAFVRPLERDARDVVAIAEEARRPSPKSADRMPDAPTKLVLVPNAILAQRDRASYANGIVSLAFLGRDRFAIGLRNSVEVTKAGNKTTKSAYGAGGSLAYDPRSQRVFAASFHAISFLDATSVELLVRAQSDVQHGPVVAFSPDGALACAGDASGWVNLYDAKGGKGLPRTPPKVFEPVYSLPESKPLAVLEGNSGGVCSIRFSADGQTLAIATAGGVRLWDVSKRKALKTIALKDGVVGADFSPLDGSLVVGREKGIVEVFDAKGRPLRKWSTQGAIAHLRVLPNGCVATLSATSLTLFDGSTGKRCAKLARKRSAMVPPRIEDVHGDTLLLRGPAAVVRVS